LILKLLGGMRIRVGRRCFGMERRAQTGLERLQHETIKFKNREQPYSKEIESKIEELKTSTTKSNVGVVVP